ncbi:MAG: thiol:disulfide interchange protein DsbA/DsbL [Acidiferrobacterales bacterium]
MRRTGKLPSFLILFLFVISTAAAADFRAGKDYEELNFPQPVETGKKIEVREFFWYGCPGCYALEPVLNHWIKNRPSNVRFIHSPSIANPSWEFHARVHFSLEVLGKESKLRKPIFNAIHKDKQRLNSVESVINLLAKHGIKRDEFLRAYNSFGVRLKLKRAVQSGMKYEIHGVPTIIVDGKYRTGPRKAGGEERMIEVMNFLIKKAAKERR